MLGDKMGKAPGKTGCSLPGVRFNVNRSMLKLCRECFNILYCIDMYRAGALLN